MADNWEYQASTGKPGDEENTKRYAALIDVIRNRVTTRQFRPDEVIPREHFELILDAARHGPSGANAQPWHYIVITDPNLKQQVAAYFVTEQRRRAKLKMKFPTPDYSGIETAPGLIVVATDFRWVRAFPVLKDDDSPLNKMYHENAERILLQSVAASTMSAHLAAAALGYNVWWITAIGQQEAQDAMKPLLGIPEELSVIDIMCFGTALKEPYKRHKRELDDIINWNQFDKSHYMSSEELDDWILNKRKRVMYRDEKNID